MIYILYRMQQEEVEWYENKRERDRQRNRARDTENIGREGNGGVKRDQGYGELHSNYCA